MPSHVYSAIPPFIPARSSRRSRLPRASKISNLAEAISWAETAPSQPKKIHIDESVCLGCGVCVRACPTRCLVLEQRAEKIITPVNSVHRVVLMAIEKGKLQNLIFDNHAFASHRTLAAILGAILKLPPVQRAMASKQLKSVYLEKLCSRIRA